MKIQDIQQYLITKLISEGLLKDVVIADNSMLIKHIDDTEIYVYAKDIQAKVKLDDKEAEKYVKTHTTKEFAQDFTEIVRENLGFYYSFLFMMEYVKLGIIDNSLAEHILNQLLFKTSELNQFARANFNIIDED